MKQGRSVQEVKDEIIRQFHSKRDFIVHPSKIYVGDTPNNISFGFETRSEGSLDGGEFSGELSRTGHIQVAEETAIPKQYYDKLLSTNTKLLASNVEFWLNRVSDSRMIRVLDNKIRAIRSNKYRPLDNYDLAQIAFPYLERKNARIVSCEITDQRLYIKAIVDELVGEVTKGDYVSAGVMMSNSEIGMGSLAIKPFLLRRVCNNGAVVDDLASRKYHVQRRLDVGSGFEFDYSDNTKTQEDKVFWMKMLEVVEKTLEEGTFKRAIELMRGGTQNPVEDISRAIELSKKRFKLNNEELNDILNHYSKSGDPTSYGFGNAITRTAQDINSYDRATELESIGFQAMQMSWN